LTIDSDSLFVYAKPSESVRGVLKRMAVRGRRLSVLALICNADNVLLGVASQGDMLRLIAEGFDIDEPITNAMVGDPVTCPVGTDRETIITIVRNQLRESNKTKNELTRFVPLVDRHGRVVDVCDVYESIAEMSHGHEYIAIYGMGFVGLTLAASLASRGHYVTGIDTNTQLIDSLNSANVHIHEPRLKEVVRSSLNDGRLKFVNVPPDNHNRVVIFAVGTPVNEKEQADLKMIMSVAEDSASKLRKGDLVILRSTVPLGTTRSLILPILEGGSNLVAGRDFHLTFCPERTVEGSAMVELTSLPQIVGGLTARCTEIAITFWQSLTDSVVKTESLEAAELVKLINNSFRDLSFAFANGVSLLADTYNIDASRLIAAANEGYPRNSIPQPSPGVGGYCLTKDPYLYASFSPDSDYAKLSIQGRKTNEKAMHYPIEVVKKYCSQLGVDLSDMNILLLGIAFKGWPQTNDTRGSTSLVVADELKRRTRSLYVYDSVIGKERIMGLGYIPYGLDGPVSKFDILLILNNHPDNASIVENLVPNFINRRGLIFDGWSMLDRFEVEKYQDLVYACMGYMTPNYQ